MQNAPQKIDTVAYLKEFKYCIENTKLIHIIYGYIKSKYTLVSFTKVINFLKKFIIFLKNLSSKRREKTNI